MHNEAGTVLDRKQICQLAAENLSLSQDKLTALLQVQLNKPDLARSTVTGILKDRTKWLGILNVNEEPPSSESESDVEEEFVEEVIRAPSLRDAKQQLNGLAVLLADNPQFSAQDEMVLQRLAIKVSKMTCSRINQRRQQSITAFYPSA